MLENFDPQTIGNQVVRQVVSYLMNLVEKLFAKVREQAEEIQRLRDEINRLKGEQGKPEIKANKAVSDVSSETERRESQPHHKESRQAKLKIDRVEVVKVDRQRLPADAQFKGYEEIIVQDVEFRTENIQFRREKYYSPSQKQTYLAPLPAGYQGQFGPGVRAWILTLYHEAGMSEPKILEVLQTVGLQISAGQISAFLIKDQEQFHAEREAVVRAGLESSPWQHLDSTGTRVNGQNQHCHVLCNPFYTAYWTLPSKDRLSLLQVLMGGKESTFQLNELAFTLLQQLGVANKWLAQLKCLLPQDQNWKEAEVDALLDEHLPKLGAQLRKVLKDGLAIAAYRSQTLWPVVELLICDDAPQFNWLTVELALCWIHEFRHYKKLIPHISYHLQLLEDFSEHFWNLYRKFLAYRHHPDPKEAEDLRTEFEQLFAQTTGYQQLDERKALTLAKKEQLLIVLIHPEILLHNNPAELGARQRVRKRDVSLQARTQAGIRAWDTFQTLVCTAKKLEVNIYQYLRDRLTQTNALPSLAQLITERAQAVSLAASWKGP